MLTDAILDHILAHLPRLTVGVLGDLFCDRYLDIDASLTEPSIETGLDAYQVVQVRAVPGAAGTVVNNLAALGIGRICLISVIGADGEGYELRKALAEIPSVDAGRVIQSDSIRTPTYTKPLLRRPGEPPRELNRLDIKNRTPLRPTLEAAILQALDEAWPGLDALVVLDQVSEPDCGVVTAAVRGRLSAIGQASPRKLILADSRERIGHFRGIALKPNQSECLALASRERQSFDTKAAAAMLSRTTGRPIFCTCGEQGILLAEGHQVTHVPAYPVTSPIDIVGAGDSTSAAIASAVAAGATLPQAAAFGNLVASITIQQIGTTGSASPEQVRQRWRQVHSQLESH